MKTARDRELASRSVRADEKAGGDGGRGADGAEAEAERERGGCGRAFGALCIANHVRRHPAEAGRVGRVDVQLDPAVVENDGVQAPAVFELEPAIGFLAAKPASGGRRPREASAIEAVAREPDDGLPALGKFRLGLVEQLDDVAQAEGSAKDGAIQRAHEGQRIWAASSSARRTSGPKASGSVVSSGALRSVVA